MACSGCLSALGFTPGCKRTPGGLNNVIYLAQLCEVEGLITREGYDNTGKITAIDPSVTWQQITTRRNTLNLTENRVDQAGVFEQTLTFIVEPQADEATADDSRQTALDFLTQLADPNAQWVAIVEERSGVRRILGLTNGVGGGDGFTFDSGTALTDVSSETVVLNGVEPEKGPVVASSITLTVAP